MKFPDAICVSLTAVTICVAQSAAALSSSGMPVFEASGYGAVRPYTELGFVRGMSARPADVGGPAELAVVSAYATVSRIERWGVNALGVPTLLGFHPLSFPPTAVLWVDVDGDGAADLVCGEQTPTGTRLEIMRMTTSGLESPGRLVELLWPLTGPVTNITAADLDSDGLVDLGITCASYSFRSGWLLNAASASSTTLVPGPAGDRCLALSLDGDTRLDLASWYSASHFTVLTKGQGGGVFGPEETMTSARGAPLAVDLDGDGISDLINGTYLHRGTGTGWPTLIDSLAMNVSAAPDLDHDGHPDLVAVEAGRLRTARGFGDFTFGVPREVQFGAAASFHLDTSSPNPRDRGLSAIADLNGDSWTDVVAAALSGTELAVLVGHPGGDFFRPLRYPTGRNSVQVALSDVVGDGALDLITLSRGSRRLEVRAGEGVGSFGPAILYATPAGATRFALRDLDSDGHQDVVVASDSSATLSILPGTGSGFGARVDVAAMGPTSDVRIVDLDEDGDLDLCTSLVNGQIVSYRGNGALGFVQAPWTSSGDNGDGRLEVGDIDADGHTDLILCEGGWSNGGPRVLFGDGSGSFGVNHGAVGLSPYRVGAGTPFTLADAVGDGHARVTYASRDSVGPTYARVNATWRESTGQLHSLPAPPDESEPNAWSGFHVPAHPNQIEVEDVTADGIPDILTLSDLCGSLTVTPGLGGGQFGSPITHVVGKDASSFALGDVDGDGLPDAVIASSSADHVLVLRHRGAAPTPVAGALVPSTLRIRAIDTASPQRIRLALRLTSDAAARVDLFDVLGRRLLTRLIDDPAAGEREVSLDVSNLPSGALVFARLTQAGGAAHLRWVNLR